jgi:hypothetical protein
MPMIYANVVSLNCPFCCFEITRELMCADEMVNPDHHEMPIQCPQCKQWAKRDAWGYKVDAKGFLVQDGETGVISDEVHCDDNDYNH